jgi:hypothetical protein
MPGKIAGLDLGYTLIEVTELGRKLVGPTRSQRVATEFGMPDLKFANLHSIQDLASSNPTFLN